MDNKKSTTIMGQDVNHYLKIMLKVAILLFIALGFFVAYKVAIFFMPFLIAWVISLIIEPLIKLFMKKFKLKRGISCAISLIIILVFIGSLLFLVISKLVAEVGLIISNFNTDFGVLYSMVTQFFTDFKIGNIALPAEAVQMLQNSTGDILNIAKNFLFGFFTGVANTISSLPNFFTALVITVLATVFICIDRDFVKIQFKKHVPQKWLNSFNRVIKETCSVSFSYIKAEAKLSFICFIFVTASLLIVNLFGLKIDYLITMALVIGFVDLLPLLGAGLVMVPWAIYLAFIGNWPVAIAVLAIWIIWAVIKQLIEPKFVSSEMGLHPIFTLIGMYAGFKLFGVLGLIIGPIILLIFKNIFGSLIEKGLLKSFFELD